jgi:hypothetical protein
MGGGDRRDRFLCPPRTIEGRRDMASYGYNGGDLFSCYLSIYLSVCLSVCLCIPSNWHLWLMPKPNQSKMEIFKRQEYHLLLPPLHQMDSFPSLLPGPSLLSILVIKQVPFSIVLCHVKLYHKHFP